MEVLERFPNCSTKILNKQPSSLAVSDRILGNDKGVGVPISTNRKLKTTKQAKHARETLTLNNNCSMNRSLSKCKQLLLALAECRFLKFSFRTWQKYCILSFLSLDRFSERILIYISSKKNAFIRVFTPTIRHFETGLFKKSGKIR